MPCFDGYEIAIRPWLRLSATGTLTKSLFNESRVVSGNMLVRKPGIPGVGAGS